MGLFKKNKKEQKPKQQEQQQQHENVMNGEEVNSTSSDQISRSLKINKQRILDVYSDCSDLITRSFSIGKQSKDNAFLLYIEGTSNSEELDKVVLKPLLSISEWDHSLEKVIESISVGQLKQLTTYEDIYNQLSNGNPILILDQIPVALSFGLTAWVTRGIEDPTSEVVVRGPREGFVESLRINTSLIRKRLRTPQLKIKSKVMGEYSKTQIAIAYLDGVCDPGLLKEVENRLNKIKLEGVLESGVLEEYLQDNRYSPFTQLLSTERPDTLCGNLLEGRVGILVEGTPFCLVLPTTFTAFIQAAEDYSQGFYITTLLRILRFLFLGIALLGPSFYIAVMTFHQEMVPTTLLLTIAQTREQVPFPALFEALLMEVTFEALREAGVRLPKQVGSAVSIVGALVIGQAAIQAGLVSPTMVIVVASTGIASFMIPHYNAAITIRMLRFPVMFISSFLGFLGLIMAVIVIIIHLCSLRSFGVPYLEPYAPFKKSGFKDSIIRAPTWKQKNRPHFTGNVWNKQRKE
ncbi:spore germination protein [Terrilactibacillus sp. BCM23-1]|uniref:Spore germination protein n=1 Tax=Terrilactibacillus tamarindi TaxID=2599694 RepID=A0A6N8CNT5_9BACI|nr:spore germination protein [Terrilactibacillus tamarindi]MTT30773.1 spore germination protein [Terrilactibacillus tamarindi]